MTAEPPLPSPLRLWGIRALWIGAGLILVGAVTGGISLWYLSSGLPSVETLQEYAPPQVTRLHDRAGRVAAELFEERRTVIPFSAVPVFVRNAFLAAEDADFYNHPGLNFFALVRAFLKNLLAGHVVQGGSTITQQVIKTFLLGPERSYVRKARELLLAFRLESNLTKDEILHLYLNQIYFGNSNYGLQEASRFYFGKEVANLALEEAALLASLPKSPTNYSPLRHPDRALERRNWVLGQMAEKNFVPAAEAEAAAARPLSIKADAPDFYALAPDYSEHVRRLLEEKLGREAVVRGGLRVELALDLDVQQAARKAIEAGLRELDRRQGYRGPVGTLSDPEIETLRTAQADGLGRGLVWSLTKGEAGFAATLHTPAPGLRLVAPVARITGAGKAARAEVDLGRARVSLGQKEVRWARPFAPTQATPEPTSVADILQVGQLVEVTLTQVEGGRLAAELSQPPLVQGALVAIEPEGRKVVALIGSNDFRRSPLIRAIQSRRQPGSAFKPFVYAAALEARIITPTSVLIDAPEVYRSGRIWKPKNYDGKFQGALTARQALSHSKNTVTVKLAERVGLAAVAAMAGRIGIESALEQNLTLALGTSEVTPLELTNAFTTFAAAGVRSPPVFIERILRPDGQEIPWEQSSPEQAIAPGVAYLMTSLLRSVIEQGTAERAQAIGRPLAGKTGTASGNKDAWFVGYAPDLVACVWVGFDDHEPMGRTASGAGAALPIWIDFMGRALESRDRRDFAVPADVVFARVDPANGLLAPPGLTEIQTEVFLEGTEPREFSPRLKTDREGAGPSPNDRLPDGLFQ